MKEKNLSRRVMTFLREQGKCPHRVESLTEKGFPDIFYVTGAIELKVASTKHSDDPAQLAISPEQKAFWFSWWRAGGKGIILAETPKNFLVIPDEQHLDTHSFTVVSSLRDILRWL